MTNERKFHSIHGFEVSSTDEDWQKTSKMMEENGFAASGPNWKQDFIRRCQIAERYYTEKGEPKIANDFKEAIQMLNMNIFCGWQLVRDTCAMIRKGEEGGLAERRMFGINTPQMPVTNTRFNDVYTQMISEGEERKEERSIIPEINVFSKVIRDRGTQSLSGLNSNLNKLTGVSTSQENRPLRVFLCHASQDKFTVRELYKRLSTEKWIEPWLDEENLLPGQDWQLEIPKAVRNADVVIVCLSQGSVSKAGYVQKEIKYALDVADEQPEGAIFLIPLKLEECKVPDRLSNRHWVNYYEENGHSKLLKAFQARAQSLSIEGSQEKP